MTEYGLYLESGPKRRKTLVHVLDLPGCVVSGPTSDEAAAAAPEAVRAFLRFLARHGEEVDAGAEITTPIAEHVTQGGFLGSGSPDVVFPGDLDPMTVEQCKRDLRRFRWMREELVDWVNSQTDAALDARPSQGRTARAIILHVLGPTGQYLSPAMGGAPGFSSVAGQAERGQLPLPEALMRQVDLAEALIGGATEEQRSVINQSTGYPRTLRRGIRRMLEHDWEHLAELSRRPGGPAL